MSETKLKSDVPLPTEVFAQFRERPPVEQLLVALITVMAVGLTAGTLYFAWERPIVRTQFAIIFFGVGTGLYYFSRTLDKLSNPKSKADATILSRWLSEDRFRTARRLDALVCFVSAVAALVVGAYVTAEFFRLSRDAIVFGFKPLDLYVGLVVVALTIDATRRAYGYSIALVAVASVAYAMAGPSLPGFLAHSGFELRDVATFGAVRIKGAFSFIMEVGATWVAVFIMFAGLARAYGALDFILGLGQKLGENLKSGVVHVAVLSSMAMGSITGSAAANAATTGSFTIPMMKKQGVRKDFAAAIESVASSGGQIMPPVMGVAAFLMADIIGVSYVRVIQAAAIPALLFYFSVGVAVQFAVLRYGWTTERGTERRLTASLFSTTTLMKVGYLLLLFAAFLVARLNTLNVPGTGVEIGLLGLGLLSSAAVTAVVLVAVRLLQSVLFTRADESVGSDFVRAVTGFFEGGHFGIPMAVLLYTLVIMELSPMSAGLYTVITIIGTMLVRDQLVDGPLGADSRATTAGGQSGALRQTGVTLGRTVYTTLRGFKMGALDMAPLVGVLASMGVIIAMVTETGLTGKISTQMVALGGGVLIVVLFLAMVTSILFGLGMPTPAAYILVATLLTGSLVDLGVVEITAHLFVFWFAMLSAITPPVAVGVAVGSRIADSGFMISAKQALRIGAAGFLVPYALIVNDSLVNWTVTATPISVFCVFVGVIALTAVTIGYDGRNVLGRPHRLAYLSFALVALYAPAFTFALGPNMATALQVSGAMLALLGLGLTQMGRLPRVVTPAARRE